MSHLCAIDRISFCVFGVISSSTWQPIRFSTMVCRYIITHLYLICSDIIRCCSTLYISLYYALCSLPPSYHLILHPSSLWYVFMYLDFFLAYFLSALEALWKYELLQFLLCLCLCSSMCSSMCAHMCVCRPEVNLGYSSSGTIYVLLGARVSHCPYTC